MSAPVDRFDQAVRALRAAGDDESPRSGGRSPMIDGGELATATRRRVVRSLERRRHVRHRMLQVVSVAGVLIVGGGAWALSTGRVPWLGLPTAAPPVALPPVTPSDELVTLVPVPRVAVAAEPAPQPVLSTDPEPPPPPVIAEKRAAPRPPTEIEGGLGERSPMIEQLYRRAHTLHFGSRDYPAALAAWDAYLAHEPGGRFAIEARYNRALVLVRLARYAEARDALAPFANGSVTPSGYRQSEARQLTERLDELVNGSQGTGHDQP